MVGRRVVGVHGMGVFGHWDYAVIERWKLQYFFLLSLVHATTKKVYYSLIMERMRKLVVCLVLSEILLGNQLGNRSESPSPTENTAKS